MSHLTGRIAVVTGGARGIGRAFVERLAADGADIAVLDLNESEETKAAVESLGRKALVIPTDVSSPEQVQAAADRIESEWGPAHVLVNNAGLHPHQTRFADTSYELWTRTMRVNLDSMFLTAKAFAPHMQKNGWGRIVNMSSSVANVAPLGGVHYIVSKIGAVGLTRALARELGPDNITVNAVAPSIVETPGMTEMQVDQHVVDAVIGSQVVKEFMHADDLAGMVSFLCTDDARFLTGQHFHTDGGIVFGD